MLAIQIKFHISLLAFFIDWKQNFYDDVLSGKIEYVSNLIDVDN